MSTKLILDKISDIILSTNPSHHATLMNMIENASRIFVAGAGRSGLVAQFFAMRLMHAGYDVFLVPGIVTQSIRKDDLLIVISGSGETKTMTIYTTKAKEMGATIVVISSRQKSTLADLAHTLCQMGREEQFNAIVGMPMGTAFEISSLIFLEILISEIMRNKGISEEEMRSRHANLE